MVRVGVDTTPLEQWRHVCSVDATGALLVRPDHHVAWRARDLAQLPELGHALAVVAGRTDAEVGNARHP